MAGKEKYGLIFCKGRRGKACGVKFETFGTMEAREKRFQAVIADKKTEWQALSSRLPNICVCYGGKVRA